MCPIDNRIPKTIYKYRDWSNKYHKRLLTHNELYVPTPKDLNDPFDCKINYDYRVLKDDEERKKFIDFLLIKHKKTLLMKGYIIEELRHNLDKRFTENLINEQKLSDKNRDIMRDKHQGVISFSETWRNLLMWSHYSNNHRGLCVGFNTKMIYDSKFFSEGGNVNYDSLYPKINPINDDSIMNLFSMLYHKSIDWSYEEEYRMTKLFWVQKTDEEFEKQKYFYFEDQIISEIILGLMIPDNHKKEIFDICDSRKIPLYQISQIPYEFKLTKLRIN